MTKHRYSRLGLIVCIAVLAASGQVRADMAEASGMLADMNVAKAEASTAWAADPSNGTAQDRLRKINEAIAEAQAAYAQLDADGGNNPAAMDALRTQRQLALGEDAAPQDTSSNEPYTAPNIHDVPWQTQGQRSLADSQYQIQMETSSHGGTGFAERDYEKDATQP